MRQIFFLFALLLSLSTLAQSKKWNYEPGDNWRPLLRGKIHVDYDPKACSDGGHDVTVTYSPSSFVYEYVELRKDSSFLASPFGQEAVTKKDRRYEQLILDANQVICKDSAIYVTRFTSDRGKDYPIRTVYVFYWNNAIRQNYFADGTKTEVQVLPVQ